MNQKSSTGFDNEENVCSGTLHSSPFPFTFLQTQQMLENERMQVIDLKNRGFADRQLQELGYSEAALHTPSVALAK